MLGPLLFVLFINDLPNEVKLNICKLFADDLKLYGVVNAELGLQSDLTNMENWSKQWQLPFNETNCKVMHFGYGNQHKTYLLNGHTLQTTDNEKDLGVIVDNKLKFHTHTAAAYKKANQMLGLVKKRLIRHAMLQ